MSVAEQGRDALARTGVYVFLCVDCDHPASDHRLRGGYRVKPNIFVCHCGCEKPGGADYASLNRAQWQAWLDKHPDWRSR